MVHCGLPPLILPLILVIAPSITQGIPGSFKLKRPIIISSPALFSLNILFSRLCNLIFTASKTLPPHSVGLLTQNELSPPLHPLHQSLHYGKVSMGGVTFRISNFLPTLEENITFTFYFNDLCLKLPL